MIQIFGNILALITPLLIAGFVIGCTVFGGHGIFKIKNLFMFLVILVLINAII